MLNRGRVAATLINGDGLRHPMRSNRPVQERCSRGLLALRRQQKIHGLPLVVHRTIEIFPFSFDADISLVHAPALTDRALLAVELFLHFRCIFDNPAVERGVIN